MTDDLSRNRTLAREIVALTPECDREPLLAWLQELLWLREADLSLSQKGMTAVRSTLDHRPVWPLVKVISRTLKKHGWTDRSWKMRLGAGTVIATVASVGSAGAGIAALGGAIGVPLWVVLGGGGVLAGLVIDELLQTLTMREPRLTGLSVLRQQQLLDETVIEGEVVCRGAIDRTNSGED